MQAQSNKMTQAKSNKRKYRFRKNGRVTVWYEWYLYLYL